MKFEAPLVRGQFLRRWRRFAADVQLDSGEVVRVHVPNSGRLSDTAYEGAPCWVMPVAGPTLPFRLELMETREGVLVGVNTQRSTALALEALETGVARLPRLRAAWRASRERSPRPGHRIDLLLDDGEPYWVEVKNITLVRDGTALFPDAVTARGSRHVRLLAELSHSGTRCAVLFIVQREDATSVRPASEIDPEFARAAAEARDAGVAFAAAAVTVSLSELRPCRPLPVVW